jgi:hypothetical protein
LKQLIFVYLLITTTLFAQNPLLLTEEKQGIIAFYQQNPFDINQVEESELIALGILESNQIGAFLLHRKQIGRFLSIYELQTIRHWDIATLRILQPLLICKSKTSSWHQSENNKNQIILRTERTIEQKNGFSEPTNRSKVRFTGNPYSTLLRYRGTWNSNIRVGFLLSKDAGELLYSDFSSAFIELKDRKGHNKLILGDYINQWGQGLVQSGSFSLGKSYESIRATQKFHGGALAYTSSGESEFYRGLNLQSSFQNIQGQLFFSSRKKDLILVKDRQYFRAFQLDGLHRTPTEISQLNKLHELAAGANLRYIGKHLDVAIAQTWTKWNYRFQPSNPLDWQGDLLMNTSLSYIRQQANVRISGEVAYTANSAWAMIQAMSWAIDKKTDLSAIIRVYEAGYFSPMANAISESSNNKNEWGVYVGHQFQRNKYQRFSSYLDLFRFPKASSSQWAAEKTGWEFLSRFQWDRRKLGHYFAQVKWTHKYLNSRNNGLIPQNLYQISIDWNRPIHKVDWHGRIMWAHLQSKEQNESGYLMLNDFNYHFKRIKIQLRTAWIWSGSYDTRLYAYEPSLPYSFLLPAYYDPSTRNVCLIELKSRDKLSFALKIARSDYFQKNVIGSGLDAIPKSHKTDIGIQMTYAP